MRLIDADELVEAFEKAMDALFTEDDNGNKNYVWSDHICIGADIEDLVECIKAQPTIEAEPVRHGEWITDDNNVTYCSECKRIDDDYHVHIFCWNCGAKMDGGNNEQERTD